MFALLLLALVGLTILLLSRRGSVGEFVGGVLSVAPFMAMIIGHLMGTL